MKEYNRKKLYLKRTLFYGMLLLLLVFTAGSAKKAYEGRRMQEDIAEKILRFHVRANSDGEADQALEVIIGAGMGHNWWCVMYPNMCFEGSVYEVVDGKSEKVLKDTLSETEYQSLMEEKNYKISWKWLDFWDK